MQPSPNPPQSQFPQAAENPFASTEAQAELKKRELIQAYNTIGSSFYSIAVFSLINSIVNYFQGGIYFPVGLGITQLIDALSSLFQQEAPQAGTIFLAVNAGLNLVILLLVALFGFFIKKQIKWLIPVGIVLYLLDGLLVLMFRDYLGAGFHGYFLYRIWLSWQTIRSLAKTTLAPSVIEPL
jgi:phosphate starvation-inducible membrane PsiE